MDPEPADADVPKGARIAAAALSAIVGLDADRATLYSDMVLSSLNEANLTALQNMQRYKYEFVSEFARRYVAEGQTRGRAAMVTRLLDARFGPLSEEVKEHIASRSSEELDAIGDRLLAAGSLQAALRN